MSSNSGTIINRSNQHSAFLNAIKSRNSKSLPELYSSEINTEAQAQSKVEVEASSGIGMGRTIRISLPRYGILNKLYLHSTFGGGTFTVSGSANGISNVPFLGAFMATEYRLMYNGSVLARLDPHTLISDLWKHSTHNEKAKLQEMIGGFDITTLSAGHSATSANVTDRWNNLSEHGGVCDFYLPLDYFFSSKLSPNRGLDLSVLANEIILEVDVETQANMFIGTAGSGTTVLPVLQNLSAVCYLTEMDQETEKQFRSLQYSPATPLTQLAFDTQHVIVANSHAVTLGATHEDVINIKLNAFSGQVFKLVVYATLADDYKAAQAHRLRPLALKEIQLKATGSNIVNLDNLDKKESLLESYHNGGDFYSISEADYAFDKINCDPNNFYELNFKHPYDFSKVSETGSIAMGQLSVPGLRIVMAQVAGYGAGAAQPTGAKKVDIHVVAYFTTLISYNTNSSGSTNIRQIMS